MKRVLPVFLAVCLLASVGIAAFADAAVSENQNAAMHESDTCVYDAVGKRLLVKSFEKKFKTPFGVFFCYEDEDGNVTCEKSALYTDTGKGKRERESTDNTEMQNYDIGPVLSDRLY